MVRESRFLLLIFIALGGVYGQTPVTESKAPANSVAIEDVTLIPGAKSGHSILKVNTAYYDIIVDSTGGKITSFIHKDSAHPGKKEIELVNKQPFQFNMYMTADSFLLLDRMDYKLEKKESGNKIEVIASADMKAISGNSEIPVTLEKHYIFNKDGHYWQFKWGVFNKGNSPISFNNLYLLPLTSIGPVPLSDSSTEVRGFLEFHYLDGSFTTKSTMHASGMSGFFCNSKKIESKQEYIEKKVDFMGMSSRFMLMVLQPMTTTKGLYDISNPETIELQIHMGSLNVKPKEKGYHEFLIYTGPKVNQYMSVDPEAKKRNPELLNIHKDIYKAFDFGVTAPIRDLIVYFLQALYKIIPNYGIVIILFSILFKAIFYPLNQAQANSMKKIQILQPKLKEINEKYKNNPMEKQKKLMEVYKKNKANPMGGCLPMVIQIPIFIALYSAFSDAYELWNSPFIAGWVDDLSRPDTVYTLSKAIPFIGGINLNILPLIMVGSQYFQTKITVVTGDENQKKMMTFLPFLMLFFFWNMPSGVVLYWIMFNLLSILQQVVTNMRKEDSVVN